MGTTAISEKQSVTTAIPKRLNLWWMAASYVCACLILICRRPEIVLHARFYAEDGTLFYADAYNHGWWRVVFTPYQGYLHFVPRITAGLALLVPLLYAPLVMNLVAICIEAIPVNLLLSFESWGSLRFRVALAALYLLHPNSGEIIGSVTESQWILALCALLIVIEGSRQFWLLGLSVLTGPFCVVLLPLACWLKRRTAAAILVIGTVMQGTAYLVSSHGHRYPGALGASFSGLFRILGAQVYAGDILGANGIAALPGMTLAIGLIGTVLMLWIAVESGKRVRCIQLFAVAVLALSVANPVSKVSNVWRVLPFIGNLRYWFFPCLAVAWSLAFAARNRRLRPIAAPLLALMLIGIVRDFRLPQSYRIGYTRAVAVFDRATPGTTVVIPEYPNGWQVVLTKH